MGRVCDVMEILQSRLATTTSRPPARDIRDTVNPPRGFDQSAMFTSYRVWDYYVYNQNTLDHENHFMHIATLYKIDAKGAHLVTDYDRHFSST